MTRVNLPKWFSQLDNYESSSILPKKTNNVEDFNTYKKVKYYLNERTGEVFELNMRSTRNNLVWDYIGRLNEDELDIAYERVS